MLFLFLGYFSFASAFESLEMDYYSISSRQDEDDFVSWQSRRRDRKVMVAQVGFGEASLSIRHHCLVLLICVENQLFPG
jgi:hypothetical protein